MAALLLLALTWLLGPTPPQTPSPSATEHSAHKKALTRVDSDKLRVDSDGLTQLRHLLASGNLYQPHRMRFVDTLALADFPQALESIQAMPAGPDRDLFLQFLFAAWGRLDPPGALQHSEAVGSIKLRAEVRDDIYRHWLTTDARVASTWLQGQPDLDSEEARRLAEQTVRHLTGIADDAEVLARIAAWPNDRARLAGARTYVEHSQLPTRDLIDWATNLEDEALRTGALTTAVRILAIDNPAEAAHLTATWDSLPNRDLVLDVVLEPWLHHDPTAAIHWVYALKPSDPQRASVHWAFAAYTAEMLERDQNYTMPVTLLEDFPESPALEEAMAGYLASVGLYRPAYTFENIHLVNDPERQREILMATAKQWVEHAPEQAQAAIEQSTLNSDQKEHLRRSIAHTRLYP